MGLLQFMRIGRGGMVGLGSFALETKISTQQDDPRRKNYAYKSHLESYLYVISVVGGLSSIPCTGRMYKNLLIITL